ncbi:MAG: hypothetical protein ACK52U_00130 [Synechococcaceae cyanobacterium]|jgi:hypothetical protein
MSLKLVRPKTATPAPAGQHTQIDHALRLRSLWLCWFLAMLFHTELGLMPLFHGISPAIESHVPAQRLPLLYWGMLIYFLIPLAAYGAISWAASSPTAAQPAWRGWKRAHFWLSVVYTATNIPHLVADIVIPDSRGDQVALMVVLCLIGLLINGEGWRWWRQQTGQE